MGEASAHAILSPSASKRWLTCTPSARFELQFPNQETVFAAEGTLAHAISEAMLKAYYGIWTKEQSDIAIVEYQKDPLYTEEMLVFCEQYADFCKSKADKDALVGVEIKLEVQEYVPEGSGTGDFLALNRGVRRLVFCDLKYGKGVSVSAVDNPQLKIYGLGALLWYAWLWDITDVEVVELNIYQPRINNYSTWEITVVELLKWAQDELVPKAKLAWDGAGEYAPGAECKFCRARVKCKALADHNLDLFKHELKNEKELSDDDILDIIKKAPLLAQWAKDIEEYALAEAVKGKKWAGMKLVEGKSNRVLSNAGAVEEKLLKAGFEDIYTTKELLGITGLKKNLGAKVFKEMVEPDLRKPPGKPTLVSVDDPRKDFDHALAVFKEAAVREEVEE